MGKNCHYKFFWIGDELGHGDVGILIKKKRVESVLSTSRVNPHILMLKMLIEKSSVNVSNHDKDKFYKQLLTCISSVENSEIHIIAEDFNSHSFCKRKCNI